MAHPRVLASCFALRSCFTGLACVAALFGTAPVLAQATCGASGPDVVIGDVSDVANSAAVNGYDAIALGAQVCNMGSVALPYSGCPNSHPIFGGNLYKFSTVNGASRFEHIGMSWLKHTAVVAAGNACGCGCGGTGTGLRPGCSDLYGSGFQSSQGMLGPRYQVNAFSGVFPYCPPHPSGTNAGKLEFALADGAATPGGVAAAIRFFAEEQAVAPDDAAFGDATHPVGSNGWNNATNCEMSVTGSAADWNFAKFGTSQRGTPAIKRWKEIDPTVTETTVDVPGEGRFIVCSKATNLGGSPALWHYEYAVFNLNSDRCAGSFSVPNAVSVSNAGFRGVLYRAGDGIGNVNTDGTPWSGALESNAYVWRTTDHAVNPNANAIRWSTLYNFRFDSTSPPNSAGGEVTVGLWKPGTPSFITAAAQVPQCIAPVVTSQPVPAFACPNGAAQFSVGATGGASGLAYTWQVQTNPGSWRSIGATPLAFACGGGAQAAVVPVNADTVAIAIRPCPGVGSYQVRVRVSDASGCASVLSDEATYTVCKADFNCSTTISVIDIFDYVNAWLAADMRADFDEVGGLQQADVFGFVNAWFTGC